jgi:hypothetical protein
MKLRFTKRHRVAAIGLAVILMAATVVETVFEQLEVNEEKAKTMMVESFGRGILIGNSDVVKKARAFPVDMQVEATRELIKFAKEYSKTDDFKKRYAKFRNEELGYRQKKGIANPFKMVDKAIDKQLNRVDDEKKMPSDPEELIKKRLHEFLDVSATVNFDAKVAGYSFADPIYESKSPQWKACYRAGREVIAAAREEAQIWLKELQ